MIVGLDLGSSEFRSLIPDSGRLIARRALAEYLTIEDSSASRSLLEQLKITPLIAEQQLVLVGESAQRVATLLKTPCIPLLPQGQLPARDPIARQICDLLLDLVLPGPWKADVAVRCLWPQAAAGTVPSTQRFLKSLIERRIQCVQPVHPATALVLAQGASSGFTAIGLVLGATSTSLSICRHGQALAETVVPRGLWQITRDILRQRQHYIWDAHGNRLWDLDWSKRLLSDPAANLDQPRTGEHRELARACLDLLRRGWQQLAPHLASLGNPVRSPHSWTVLLGGGGSQLAGLDLIVQKAAESVDLPIRIQTAPVIRWDPYLLVRGALIAEAVTSASRAA